MPTPTQLPAEKPPRRTIAERLAALRDVINNQNTQDIGLNWGQATAVARDLDAIIEDLPKPDQELPDKPGRPDKPDQGLPDKPGRPDRPDHELPDGPGPKPDNELPETPDPKRGQTGRR